MSVHTHPKERQREPLIVVGFKIVEITLKTAIEACYIVAAIGKDFSYFLAPPSLSTIDYDSSICGHGFEHMGQRVEWCIDGTFDRVGSEVGWFPQVEQRDRIRVELGKFRRRDAAVRCFTALIVIDRIMQSNRHVLPLSF